MSKKKRERALSETEAKAVARMLRVSPQKLNLVAGLIRGKKVAMALADLEFSRKRIARDVRKCLESAIANAENNHDLDVDDLVVAEAFVGKAHRDQAFHPARPRPRRTHFQAVRQPDHRRASGRSCGVVGEDRWVRRSIRSACGSASTAPGIRAGIAGKNEYGKLLHEDMAIREELTKQLKQAAVSKIVIERPHKKCRVTIHSARPGVVIGKKGADIEKLRKKVAELTDSDVVHQHHRDPQAGARRAAGRRIDRPAARAARRLPPRHEARGAVGDAARRRRHPHQLRRPARRRRNRAHGVVSRGPRAAAHAARRRRLRRRDRVHHLRHLRRQGLDLQGRDHGARPDGAGQEDWRKATRDVRAATPPDRPGSETGKKRA